MPIARLIIITALAAYADPCRLIWVGPEAKAVTITCNYFPPGVTKSFREYIGNEWNKEAGLDTIPAPMDTVKK